MLFPWLYLVICTSDLNSILGILFYQFRHLFDQNEVNKVLQEATPNPQNFYYRSGEVTKLTKMTPKTRKSADQRNNLIPAIINALIS